MYGQIIRIVCGVAIISSATALIAAPPSIITKPLACVAKDRNARITARVVGRATSVRVFFRAIDPKCNEYFVDMRQSPADPTLYWAVLPLTGPETRMFSYQVRLDPGNGEKLVVSPSEPLTVSVHEGCIADPVSQTEQRAADNITLGLVSAGQRGAPCGFRCDGITSILTTANELRPNEECFRILAANKAWYTTGTAKKALGAGVVLLGGALIWNDHQNDDRAVSPARP